MNCDSTSSGSNGLAFSAGVEVCDDYDKISSPWSIISVKHHARLGVLYHLLSLQTRSTSCLGVRMGFLAYTGAWSKRFR